MQPSLNVVSDVRRNLGAASRTKLEPVSSLIEEVVSRHFPLSSRATIES